MTILSDKLLLLTVCTLLMFYRTPYAGLFQVLGFLSAIIFSCGCSCCNPNLQPINELAKPARLVLAGFYLVLSMLCLASPVFGSFLPLLFYEITVSFRQPFYHDGNIKTNEQGISMTYSLILTFTACLLLAISFRDESPVYLGITLLLYPIACVLSYKTKRLLHLEHDFRLLRDTSTEYHLLLQQKNKDLIEKQDYEIHVATLRERNRIAREIHDNVGHLLSRSILQSGALIAINGQENLNEPLHALKQTLSHAMDEIRNSVHGLHDDSIDLKNAVSDMLADFSNYKINLDYDMNSFVPAPVKYCFISIIKESLSNIARHSNATDISITLRSHPRLHQLTIADNGTSITLPPEINPSHSGIGILNMQERVKSLNGNFSISTEHGFVVFVSIPS